MTVATIKTVYILDGKEYKDINNINEYLTNKLGRHIDNMVNNHKLPPKVALYAMDYLIKNKDDIINILSTKVECDKDHCLDGESYINILSNEIEYDNKWGT